MTFQNCFPLFLENYSTKGSKELWTCCK
jgi:hypothetical protein